MSRTEPGLCPPLPFLSVLNDAEPVVSPMDWPGLVEFELVLA